MQLSEKIDEITKGLVLYRQQLEQPKKDAKNPFFKSKYVTLDGVINAIDKAIKGTGIAYVQEATSGNNEVSVSTWILHESGQHLAFEPLSVPVSKNDAQAYGSAVTYAKRYALAAAFGVSSDVDDDGNDSVKNAPQSPKKISGPNVAVINKKLQEIADNHNMTLLEATQTAFKRTGITKSSVSNLTDEEGGIVLNFLNQAK